MPVWATSTSSCHHSESPYSHQFLVVSKERAEETIRKLIHNLERVIVGKREAVEFATLAMIGNGHLLIEDVPGLGKTTLARALALSIEGEFSRIQFTPDLLPSDVTGVSIFNQKTREFEFRKGPVFGNVVLADEINRGTPRVQSSLLEAMEERTVTNDGVTYPLPHPFLVIATQNPIEFRGTFPLPEAQLDRFFGSVSLGYPSVEHEKTVLRLQEQTHPIRHLEPVVSVEDILMVQEEVRDVYIDESLREYIVRLCTATRHHDDVLLGASPRGSLALMRASQGYSLINGDAFVSPDAVKATAVFALGHRLILHPRSKTSSVSPRSIILSLQETVEVPLK